DYRYSDHASVGGPALVPWVAAVVAANAAHFEHLVAWSELEGHPAVLSALALCPNLRDLFLDGGRVDNQQALEAPVTAILRGCALKSVFLHSLPQFAGSFLAQGEARANQRSPRSL